MTETVYACLACGSQVFVRTETAADWRTEITVAHPLAGDAACAWFLQTLSDDVTRMARSTMDQVVAHMRRSLDERSTDC